ncbi:IclR family transcriptional regulator [Roseospira visakhapatnamensis]|uniref:DNA-binding IclR family transcriptional regulator n=1 Tax=Roseospira visakhapatnamensis TaxID=390880 RepID=A0A7W6RHA3_9PROT|nr:IclR family transcriptional regulator [Roseospira visakhapatnamensis]MBB4267961.1 DNA-binding IclR family transcriptional regulator [Roseospira visakhapatnamensis]
MSPSDSQRKPPVAGTQTLMRGLTVLELVANGVRDVKGLSSAMGTTRGTMHRMLSSLVADGYLHHIPYGGYFLGPKLIRLGMAALEERPVVALAKPHIEALARSTGDTIHLGVLDGSDVLYLDKISGSRGLLMRSRIGQHMPLATSGLGKALMLDLPAERWKDFYDRATLLKRQAGGRPNPIPWARYADQMKTYRETGWVYDLEENETDIRCVAAPIRDVSGRVVASVSVTSAILYMPDDRMAQLGPQVRATAEAISVDLGWGRP